MGWHVPSDDEWKELEMTLGMSQSMADVTGWRDTDEGKKLKSTSDWNSYGNGIDEVGFSAYPGGYRLNYYGYFNGMGTNTYFWSALEINTTSAWTRKLYYDNDNIFRSSSDKRYGFSVRCVQDSH